MPNSASRFTSSAAAKREKSLMTVQTALRATALIALGVVSITNAAATPIDPNGSVNIDLPSPGRVTSSSPTNALLVDSTVTVRGQRFVGSLASTGSGPYNLGIGTGDPASILTNGIYQNGNYSASTSLKFIIDGLFFDYDQVTARYFQVGQSKYQIFAFSGFMEVGANSVTGQEYNPATSLFSFQLTQAGINGGAINYSTNLTVSDDVTIPEPMSIAFLGFSLLTLGTFRILFKKVFSVSSPWPVARDTSAATATSRPAFLTCNKNSVHTKNGLTVHSSSLLLSLRLRSDK